MTICTYLAHVIKLEFNTVYLSLTKTEFEMIVLSLKY